MYAHLLRGNRDIFVTALGGSSRAASGRPEAVADDERGERVRLADNTCEAGEQSGTPRCGAGGGKQRDREKCGIAKHGPNAEPGSRVTGAGPHTWSCLRNKKDKKEKLTALLHHITVGVLRRVFFKLKKRAAPGVDGVTWEDYAADLDRNLTDLHARVHRGAYRALPSRRRYIPKADGKQRPLGIAAIEDKIVQAAVVALLTPIYEAEFLGFSYGFRPGRSQHDALDALAYGIKARKINWILDADISRFFDSLSGMARKIRRMPNWRPTDHPPDPEMAEGGCAGRGPLDRDNGGHPAGISGITTACKRVSPLCLRSLGPAVAQAPGYGRYDRRAVCRRYNRWLPAPA
jgi:Reverse transcriptase (RNA-dependent DNA polymerase)